MVHTAHSLEILMSKTLKHDPREVSLKDIAEDTTQAKKIAEEYGRKRARFLVVQAKAALKVPAPTPEDETEES
jgi:hypothetical protein